MSLKRSLSVGCLSYDNDVKHSHFERLDQNKLSHVNLTNITTQTNQTLKTWLLADVPPVYVKKLPLSSFNHMAREVLNLEKSKRFYVDILGFDIMPRPPLECEGYWLHGYGLSLHLILTTNKNARKLLLKERIKHFSHSLPRVDHVAFETDNIQNVKDVLDKANVYYKHEKPCSGLEQLFFFDPDGNVIEVTSITTTPNHTPTICHHTLSNPCLIGMAKNDGLGSGDLHRPHSPTSESSESTCTDDESDQHSPRNNTATNTTTTNNSSNNSNKSDAL